MTQSQDLKQINALTAAFFNGFTQDKNGRVDLEAVRRLLVSQAVIIKSTAAEAEIYDADSFLTPRAELLNSGALTDFNEAELNAQTTIFGRIAQRLSVYRKWGVMNGAAFEADGVKTFQFLKQAGVWRISSMTWEDESEDLPIPATLRSMPSILSGQD